MEGHEMSEPCEHDWAVSPLLAYLATRYDGPNYRTVRLEICSKCGLLRAPIKWAGYETWDDLRENPK